MSYLKLDHELWESGSHLMDELVHELFHFLVLDTVLPQTKVERIIQISLGICSKVEANGNSGFWSNSESMSVFLRRNRRLFWPYPAPAIYRDSFPIEMPIPLTPRSPSPKIREPSLNW
jgi:hypothetical protein